MSECSPFGGDGRWPDTGSICGSHGRCVLNALFHNETHAQQIIAQMEISGTTQIPPIYMCECDSGFHSKGDFVSAPYAYCHVDGTALLVIWCLVTLVILLVTGLYIRSIVLYLSIRSVAKKESDRRVAAAGTEDILSRVTNTGGSRDPQHNTHTNTLTQTQPTRHAKARLKLFIDQTKALFSNPTQRTLFMVSIHLIPVLILCLVKTITSGLSVDGRHPDRTDTIGYSYTSTCFYTFSMVAYLFAGHSSSSIWLVSAMAFYPRNEALKLRVAFIKSIWRVVAYDVWTYIICFAILINTVWYPSDSYSPGEYSSVEILTMIHLISKGFAPSACLWPDKTVSLMVVENMKIHQERQMRMQIKAAEQTANINAQVASSRLAIEMSTNGMTDREADRDRHMSLTNNTSMRMAVNPNRLSGTRAVVDSAPAPSTVTVAPAKDSTLPGATTGGADSPSIVVVGSGSHMSPSSDAANSHRHRLLNFPSNSRRATGDHAASPMPATVGEFTNDASAQPNGAAGSHNPVTADDDGGERHATSRSTSPMQHDDEEDEPTRGSRRTRPYRSNRRTLSTNEDLHALATALRGTASSPSALPAASPSSPVLGPSAPFGVSGRVFPSSAISSAPLARSPSPAAISTANSNPKVLRPAPLRPTLLAAPTSKTTNTTTTTTSIAVGANNLNKPTTQSTQQSEHNEQIAGFVKRLHRHTKQATLLSLVYIFLNCVFALVPYLRLLIPYLIPVQLLFAAVTVKNLLLTLTPTSSKGNNARDKSKSHRVSKGDSSADRTISSTGQQQQQQNAKQTTVATPNVQTIESEGIVTITHALASHHTHTRAPSHAHHAPRHSARPSSRRFTPPPPAPSSEMVTMTNQPPNATATATGGDSNGNAREAWSPTATRQTGQQQMA